MAVFDSDTMTGRASDKSGGRTALGRWLDAGRLRYLDTKQSHAWEDRAGLLSAGMSSTRGTSGKLLTQRDFFKYRARDVVDESRRMQCNGGDADQPLARDENATRSDRPARVPDKVFTGDRSATDGKEPASGIPEGLQGQHTAASTGLGAKLTRWLRQNGKPGTYQFREIGVSSLPEPAARGLRAMEAATGRRIAIVRNLTPELGTFNGVSFKGDREPFCPPKVSKAPLNRFILRRAIHCSFCAFSGTVVCNARSESPASSKDCSYPPSFFLRGVWGRAHVIWQAPESHHGAGSGGTALTCTLKQDAVWYMNER
ncbi:MAG: hypothetical protein ACREPL_06445 [Rhodanobacteraceae bacterium]